VVDAAKRPIEQFMFVALDVGAKPSATDLAPGAAAGEAVSPAVLLVTLAQDAITYQRLGGRDAAVQMVRARSGGAYDPRHVDHFCAHASALMRGLDDEPSWELVLACEPGERPVLTETQFDTACQALADFADIKSPYTLGHSPGVAALASAAARIGGLRWPLHARPNRHRTPTIR